MRNSRVRLMCALGVALFAGAARAAGPKKRHHKYDKAQAIDPKKPNNNRQNDPKKHRRSTQSPLNGNERK